MDWLVFLTLLAQIILATPVILFVAYTIGYGFTTGVAAHLMGKAKRLAVVLAEAQKNNEKDIL